MTARARRPVVRWYFVVDWAMVAVLALVGVMLYALILETTSRR